ncbi:helix-turn-helix domain-containing protein [Bacteroidota bacterium]
MKERLIDLLKSLNLSASKFAHEIGIQPSSVSHVLSGRNKPSFDFISKTLERFPAVNTDWFILGKGDMFKSNSDNIKSIMDENGYSPTLFDLSDSQESNIPEDNSENVQIMQSQADKNSMAKKTEKIVIFYSNNSYKEYHPSS